jgi:hypothetical protein
VVGVLWRGILLGPEETAVELSAASMPEQGKRKARKSRLGHACKGKRRGSDAGDTTRRQGENGARHPGSCVGAAEMGAGRAVSGAMQKQGSGWHVWAARESVGRSGGRSWARPESNSADFDLK